jgi:hypothetical protein
MILKTNDPALITFLKSFIEANELKVKENVPGQFETDSQSDLKRLRDFEAGYVASAEALARQVLMTRY